MFTIKCISMMLVTTLLVSSSTIEPIPTEEIKMPVVDTPIIEMVDEVTEEVIEEEPLVEPEEIIEVPAEPEPGPLPLTDAEIDLIALCVMGEAEGESEEGKRMVIDVILNRLDSPRFANTVHGVIYTKGAFECMWNGRVNRCYVRDDIRELVIEELLDRSYSNIHYFRTKHYHSFGKPVVQVGNHYFSTY